MIYWVNFKRVTPKPPTHVTGWLFFYINKPTLIGGSRVKYVSKCFGLVLLRSKVYTLKSFSYAVFDYIRKYTNALRFRIQTLM